MIENTDYMLSGGYDGTINVWEYSNFKKINEWYWGGWIYNLMPIKKH